MLGINGLAWFYWIVISIIVAIVVVSSTSDNIKSAVEGVGCFWFAVAACLVSAAGVTLLARSLSADSVTSYVLGFFAVIIVGTFIIAFAADSGRRY